MKHPILLVGAVAALLVAVCGPPVELQAAQRKTFAEVDVDALTGETQQTIGADKAMNLLWVIPTEFWEASLAQDETLPESQRRTVIDALNNYIIIGAVRADISPLGAFRFHDEASVFDSMQVSYTNADGDRVPLALFLRVDGDAQLIVDSVKPVLKAAMGRMGDSFHLFICENRDPAGRPIISPYEPGTVRIDLDAIGQNEGGTAEIAFPLDALFVPRQCPQCSRQAHVSWEFCPWCGTKHTP